MLNESNHEKHYGNGPCGRRRMRYRTDWNNDSKAAEVPQEDAAQETAGQAEVTPAEEQEVNELAMDVSEIILELSQENEQPPYEYEYMGDLTQITGFSAEELEALVEGTGLEGLCAFYAEKEQTHGINALFLIAVAKLEKRLWKEQPCKEQQ